MKLLLVGADRDLLNLATNALEPDGFEILTARDGASALNSWRMDRPDLMLLAVSLDDMSGIDLCRQIREDDSRGSDTPIIVVIEGSSEEEIIGGLIAGADDYVTRSFSRRQLSARIRAVLRRRGILDENGQDTRSTEATSAELVVDGTATEPFDFTGFLALVPEEPAAVKPIRPEAWVHVVVPTEHQEIRLRQRNLGCA